MRRLAAFALAFLLFGPATRASESIFMLRTTATAPDAVAAAIRAHAEQRKWQHLGETRLRNGEVTLVKLCMPEVARALRPAGLQLSAMLPCGNIGIYRKDGTTEISVLHPRYMPFLHPHPATEQAAAIGAPLLAEMLDAVSR